jgi:hypothetical protein
MKLEVEVTAEDIAAARLVGATGTELMEAAIHTALDRRGVPREGRSVRVTLEITEIVLPKGYTLDGVSYTLADPR